nr:reverse transcriptase domain-containing protein [Tanacetum cinerariifolium]
MVADEGGCRVAGGVETAARWWRGWDDVGGHGDDDERWIWWFMGGSGDWSDRGVFGSGFYKQKECLVLGLIAPTGVFGSVDNCQTGCLVQPLGYVVPTSRVVVPTGRVVVPTGRIVVPTGRYVVSTSRVVVPTGRVISPGRIPTGRYVVLTCRVVVPTSRVISPSKIPTGRALKHCNFDLNSAGDHQKFQMNELNELRDQAYENSLIYKEKTKKIHDSKIKNRVFNIGDRVLLFNF